MKKFLNLVNISLFIICFFTIFYIGSTNANILGRWQGFEIVFPIIISVFLSLAIMSIILFLKYLLELFILKTFKK